MTKINLAEMLQNYEQTLQTLGLTIRKDWAKELLHARRMKGNACKISYITKSKIEGLIDNVEGFKLNPQCEEQRAKHFTAERPNKFFNRIVDTSENYNSSLLAQISERFNQSFLENIKTRFVMFSGAEIGEQYAKCKGMSGCMSGDKGSQANWFDCYADTNGLRLCALIDEGNTILIRALLWYDKTSRKYFLDKTYEQHNINGDEELRRNYQAQLLRGVLKAIRRKKIDCAFNSCLHKKDMQEGVKTYPSAHLQPSTFPNTRSYEYVPYSDTWKSLSKNTGDWVLDEMDGDCDYYYMNDTNGICCNEERLNCYDCGNRYREGDEGIFWSEYNEEYYCEDCSNYCEDRETYVGSGDTRYDNYRGVFVVANDIE